MSAQKPKTSYLDHAAAALVSVTAKKEYKHLDVAIVKATNHDICAPKEKHVQTLLDAVKPGTPVADSVYIIQSIQKLVQKTSEWLVMLKAHMLLHRLISEGGEEFKAELEKTKQGLAEMRDADSRSQDLFNIRYWKDDSNTDAHELSGWTRTYALYLEDLVSLSIAVPWLNKKSEGSGPSPLRAANMEDLMEQLPQVQGSMRRLIDSELITESLSQSGPVVSATAMLLKESFKLYRLSNDGIINLIDKFFEMSRVQALKALEVYKRATSQGNDLARFYRTCSQIDAFRDAKMPTIDDIPASFLQTMEDYVKDAPATSPAPAAAPAAAPAPAPAPAPAGTPNAGFNDLFGGMSVSSPAPAAPAPAASPFAASPAAAAADPFAAPNPAPSPAGNPFGAPAPAPAPAPAAAPAASTNPFGSNPFGDEPNLMATESFGKDQLDKLYAQPQQPAFGGAPMGGMMGGMQQPGMMGGMGMHQQQPGMMGGMGMHQQPGMMGMQQQHPGMMGGMGMQQQHPGMMGGMGMQQQQPGMMGGMGMQQQQPGMMGGMGMQQQQPGMMGGMGGMQQRQQQGAGSLL